MYYLTYYKQEQFQQLTLEDLYNENYETQNKEAKNITIKTNNTDKYIVTTNELNTKCIGMLQILLNQTHALNKNNLSEHYHTFRIPKKTGEFREINAPDDNLKLFQTNMKFLFETILKILPNDAAYAYVKNRSTVDALKKHKHNNAKWFLKIDIKDFFPSHNLEYIIQQLKLIYPTACILDTTYFPTTAETTETQLRELLSYCLLEDKLPQGSPLSPTLTNLLMTPIDYEIQQMLYKENNFFTYTRYADDMIISSPAKFNWKELIEKIKNIFNKFNTPFEIKEEKTRYGSNTGRNWNLGLMYNKDQNITIGHVKKQKFRAKIHQFCSDNLTEETKWNKIQTQQLAGEIAYYKMIEPDYIEYVIEKYDQKFKCNIKRMLKIAILD